MIRLIAMRELRGLLAAPSTWFVLGALQFVLAWFFLKLLDNFLQTQAQIALIGGAVGATQAVAGPFLFWGVGMVMAVLVPIFAMRLIAEDRRNQTFALLLSAPVSATQIALGKFIGLVTFLWLLVLAWTAMALALALGTPMDLGLLLSNACGLLLLTAAYAALGLYVSALTAQPVVAAFGTLITLLGLWVADFTAVDGFRFWHELTPTGHFRNFNGGLLDSSDLAYFALFCALFLMLAIRRLNNNRIYG